MVNQALSLYARTTLMVLLRITIFGQPWTVVGRYAFTPFPDETAKKTFLARSWARPSSSGFAHGSWNILFGYWIWWFFPH